MASAAECREPAELTGELGRVGGGLRISRRAHFHSSSWAPYTLFRGSLPLRIAHATRTFQGGSRAWTARWAFSAAARGRKWRRRESNPRPRTHRLNVYKRRPPSLSPAGR
jgi:hypothetical protein